MRTSRFPRLLHVFAVALALGGCALEGDTASEDGSNPTAPEQPGVAVDVDVDDPSDVDLPGAQPEETSPVKATTLDTVFGKIDLKYREVDGDALAEGDMIVPSTQANSATMIGRHWPRGVIPYVIDANLPSPERILGAIAHWEAKTKLRFVARTVERDYVHFRSHASACSSSIGQIGDAQYVNIQTAEDASTVAAVGIDRSVDPAKVHFFYTRGFATTGSVSRAAALTPHFRYLLPPGKSQSWLIDVAFASNGHLFAWYADGTVSEGDVNDFALYAAPKRFALATNKRPSDVAGFAIDNSDKAHAFYTDSTFSVGTVTNLATTAQNQPFSVATGKSVSDLAHVDVAADGSFVAFYNKTGSLQSSIGTASKLGANTSSLGRTGFPGQCSTGSTVHEIGHAVGLFHEQTRHDRDRYLRIVWENIQDEDKFNFEKHSRMIGADTGAYDFGSIMHYGPYAFSKNGQKTMLRVDGQSFQEQRRSLSPGDVAAVTEIYK